MLAVRVGSAVTPIEDEEPREEEIDLIVMKLRQVSREASLDYAIRIGSLIVHHFYRGEVNAWRLKQPKPTSFRRLAARPDLPMSASVLYRCVAIFELCERLGAVSRWRHMTASHLRAVLNLDERHQVRLLASANSEGWSVQRLEDEALGLRNPPTSASRGFRGSALVKFVLSVKKRIETLSMTPEPDVRSMTQAQRELIVSSIETLTDQLDLIRRNIRDTEVA